ncbi:transcription termination factor 2, mitochondrial-like [Genypterus blacodes]|uniref:transcription termination factor 2, mitochondrial-like n=1 Tax=Genypterus blacodes TaxID=154954 RepID=UPI003F75CE54
MLRLIAKSLCRRVPALPLNLRPCATLNSVENRQTVEALYDLCVDIQKVRQLKRWVLHQSLAYVPEVAALLRDMGASGSIIAQILMVHPEAVLCSPEQMQAQRDLWVSVCPNQRELVGVIEKFPASFFTSSSHHANQRQNIAYFKSLNVEKRHITKLMASAPQSFSRPVEQNEAMVCTLQQAYQELGGEEANMKIWLQKLLCRNPLVLLTQPDVLKQNLLILRDKGFSTAELIRLIAKLKGFVSELNPDRMRHTLTYSQVTMSCSESELRHIILHYPALLYYHKDILEERFEGLCSSGISMSQIMKTPTVLELTTQIVKYRIQQLKAFGFDTRKRSLKLLRGTEKDFEATLDKLWKAAAMK